MESLDQHIRAEGLTRACFAKRVGISAPYLTQILAGAKRPSLDLAVRIERETGGKVPANGWISASEGVRAEGAA